VAKFNAFTGRTSNTGINGYQTENYGYEGATGFKTVGFRSNAPAGPWSCLSVKFVSYAKSDWFGA